MNNLDQQFDDAPFDRLVDGELAPDEYRALLATLDDEPGGWRRCALAFLESQALESELGGVREERIRPKSTPMDQPLLARTFTSYLPVILAMAACFLVAFGLGFVLRTPATEIDGVSVAEDTPIDAPPETHFATDDSPAQPDWNDPDEPAPQNVTLVVGDNEADAQRYELPVVEYGDVGDAFLVTERTAVTPEFEAELQRRGYRTHRSERLMPLMMNDGRQVVVPVEEVEIVPVDWPVL